MGSVDNSRIRTTPIRNAGFVSFFNETGCLTTRTRNSDIHDQRLRRQKRVRALALIALTALCTWIVVESARAITWY